MFYARYMPLLIVFCMLNFYYIFIHSFFGVVVVIIPNNLRTTPSSVFRLSKRPPL